MARFKIELTQTKMGIIFSVYEGQNLQFELLDQYKQLGLNRAKELAIERENIKFFESLPKSFIEEKINKLESANKDEFTEKAINFLKDIIGEEDAKSE